MRIFNQFDDNLIYEYGEKPKKLHQKHYNLASVLALISFVLFCNVLVKLIGSGFSHYLLMIFAVILFAIFILMSLTYQKWGKVLTNAKAHLNYKNNHYSIEIKDNLHFLIKEDKQKDIEILSVKDIRQDNDLAAVIVFGDIRQGDHRLGSCFIPMTLLHIKDLIAYLKFSQGQSKVIELSNNSLIEVLNMNHEQKESLLYDEIADSHFLLCTTLRVGNGINVTTSEGINLSAYQKDGYLQAYADLTSIPYDIQTEYPLFIACTISSVSQIYEASDSDIFKDQAKMLGLDINVDNRILRLSNDDIKALVR